MKNKRYLTGVDWLIHVFDHMNRKTIESGNEFHIVLKVDGVVQVDFFENDLNAFLQKYSVFKGKVARAWNLAPFWKVRQDQPIVQTATQTTEILDLSEFDLCLDGLIKKHKYDPSCYLFSDLIICKGQTFVVFTFSHKIFDGLGGELFLQTFQNFSTDRTGFKVEEQSTEPSHLDKWTEKFRSGRTINRALIKMSPERRLRSFPLDAREDSNYVFARVHFTEKESARIIEQANKKAGYLLVMPFLLARTVQIFSGLFDKRGFDKDNIVVPVTVNARKEEKKAKKMFFNHLSFLFFKFEAEEMGKPERILTSVKEQLFDQIKNKFSKQFMDNAMLMRILPVSLLSKLLGLYSKGAMASFSFSYVGETVYKSDTFLGQPVSNLFHLPRPSVPPGLGVIFSNYKGKLNLTISYFNNIFTEEDIDYMKSGFKKLSDE